MTCGIYKIVNRITGNFYIGQSRNIEHRIKEHFKELSNGEKGGLFQLEYNNFGEGSFEYQTVIECEIDQDLLNILESYYIEKLNPKYNSTGGGIIIDIPNKRVQLSNYKQTDSQLRNDMIYQYYLSHDISYKELAEMFNISYGQVRTLVSRRGGKKK